MLVVAIGMCTSNTEPEKCLDTLNASHGKVKLCESCNRREDDVDRRPQDDVD